LQFVQKNELDCRIDRGDSQIPMEIKAGRTVNPDFFIDWLIGFQLFFPSVVQKASNHPLAPLPRAHGEHRENISHFLPPVLPVPPPPAP